MNFGQAVVSGLRNYIIFSGRASRSEYWFFMVFFGFAVIGGMIADLFLFAALAAEGISPLTLAADLVFILPAIAVSVRRLHDIDRTGWWFLIALTVIGNILLLVWACTKGTDGRNRFGPDPLAAK
jgi:uncharacterized membrane protein YhaH (DUF805 family)